MSLLRQQFLTIISNMGQINWSLPVPSECIQCCSTCTLLFFVKIWQYTTKSDASWSSLFLGTPSNTFPLCHCLKSLYQHVRDTRYHLSCDRFYQGLPFHLSKLHSQVTTEMGLWVEEKKKLPSIQNPYWTVISINTYYVYNCSNMKNRAKCQGKWLLKLKVKSGAKFRVVPKGQEKWKILFLDDKL